MVYLGVQTPGKPWSVKSRGLAEGLMLYEQSVNRFGIPLREATDPDMDGWYEVDDEEIDYSEAAFEEYSRNNKNPEPGVMPRIINTRVADRDRPPEARTPVGGEGLARASSSHTEEESLDEVGDGLKVETSI